MILTVVIPMLERGDQAADVNDSVAAATTVAHELLFICSPDDDDGSAGAAATGAPVITTDWPAGPGDYARKINLGLRLAAGEWLFTGAVDLEFHVGYDRVLERVDDGCHVIGTNDLGNNAVKTGGHSTHSFVRVAYARAVGLTWTDGPGFVYHEGYDHQNVDNELVAVARQRGIWRHAGDSHVEHLHPFWGKSRMDATYEKGLKHGGEDSRLFAARRRENA